MPDNVRGKVEARLRKRHDDDLREATAGIDSGLLSEMVRDGLRVMLGIRTKMQTEVKERPLHIPSQTTRQTIVDTVKPVSGKPAVFKPNFGGKSK